MVSVVGKKVKPKTDVRDMRPGTRTWTKTMLSQKSIDWLDGLPAIVEAGDLRGAFHNHTTASDGRNTLAEMTAAAEALGWEYLGIADHSKSSFQANGLNEERLLRRVAAVVRKARPRIVLTHSPEDYMEDHMNTCRLVVTVSWLVMTT